MPPGNRDFGKRPIIPPGLWRRKKLVVAEVNGAQRRNTDLHGIGETVKFRLFRVQLIGVVLVAAAVFFPVSVENFIQRTAQREADAVDGVEHRREVTHAQYGLSGLVRADKGHHAVVCVVSGDPLETVPVIVKVVQTRIFPVNMKKITDIFLKLFMARKDAMFRDV